MPRKYEKIDCSKEVIIELTKIASDTSNIRLATRAKIVLGCIEGKQIKDIAAELNERPNTVITWRRRFAENGIEGLLNRPRGYSGNRYGTDLRERILSKLTTTPPDGMEHWTGNTLSRELNVPPDVIWRCLRKEGIKLADVRISTDNESGLPIHVDYNIPLVLSVREDSFMDSFTDKNDITEKQRMDLVLTAKVVSKDGQIIEKEIRIEDALPDINDFDLSTKDGFLSDFHEVEKSLLQARGMLTEELVKDYLEEASKKNRSAK